MDIFTHSLQGTWRMSYDYTHMHTHLLFKLISLLHRGHTPLNQIYLGATGFSEDQLHVEG